MDKKKPYEKPALRKVRLEVKTSVLGFCHNSTLSDPMMGVGGPCKVGSCFNPNLP